MPSRVKTVCRVRSLLALAVSAAICAMPALGRTHRRKHTTAMEATAFARHFSPTAAGTAPHRGIVAADPAVLPFGSRIRVTGAGRYNGQYVVTDTGGKIDGRHIDLYMPSAAEARRFGKKIVYVRVLQWGAGKQDARAADMLARVSPHNRAW